MCTTTIVQTSHVTYMEEWVQGSGRVVPGDFLRLPDCKPVPANLGLHVWLMAILIV